MKIPEEDPSQPLLKQTFLLLLQRFNSNYFKLCAITSAAMYAAIAMDPQSQMDSDNNWRNIRRCVIFMTHNKLKWWIVLHQMDKKSKWITFNFRFMWSICTLKYFFWSTNVTQIVNENSCFPHFEATRRSSFLFCFEANKWNQGYKLIRKQNRHEFCSWFITLTTGSRFSIMSQAIECFYWFCINPRKNSVIELDTTLLHCML